MELTASYIRRVPDNNKNNNNKSIRVVRSDLRLKLDRGKPFINNNNNDQDEKSNNNNNNNNNKKWNGWNWNGTFEHEEGLLQCYESDLNNFKFRRNLDWKLNAIKFTCRE